MGACHVTRRNIHGRIYVLICASSCVKDTEVLPSDVLFHSFIYLCKSEGIWYMDILYLIIFESYVNHSIHWA